MREKRIHVPETVPVFDRPRFVFVRQTGSRSDVFDDTELAEHMVELLGLDHGPGYGQDFFNKNASAFLEGILEALPCDSSMEVAEEPGRTSEATSRATAVRRPG